MLEGLERVSRRSEVVERSKDIRRRGGVGGMTKEKLVLVELVFLCSMDLRIGWAFWSLLRAFWRSEISGSFEI